MIYPIGLQPRDQGPHVGLDPGNLGPRLSLQEIRNRNPRQDRNDRNDNKQLDQSKTQNAGQTRPGTLRPLPLLIHRLATRRLIHDDCAPTDRRRPDRASLPTALSLSPRKGGRISHYGEPNIFDSNDLVKTKIPAQRVGGRPNPPPVKVSIWSQGQAVPGPKKKTGGEKTLRLTELTNHCSRRSGAGNGHSAAARLRPDYSPGALAGGASPAPVS